MTSKKVRNKESKVAAKKTQVDSDNPTHKEVWDTLSSINVNEHTESKMNLTYLSWAWAWKILKDNYPNATYAFTSHGENDYEQSNIDYMRYPDESGSVFCTIYIGKHVKESMWLPVMDNRNNAIKNPNARQISDAKMRCLVKCISMLGLGLYIYAGEDLPDEGGSDESSERGGDSSASSSKSDPAKKAVSKAPKDEGSGKDDGTDDKVSLTLITFAKEAESVKELNKFFRDNREVIDRIEVSKPEEHAKIMSAFASRKRSLEGTPLDTNSHTEKEK
tara:strand:- start:5615 stop:6442 length:828 start_codon:yes stop_codon:yes gene_type:complete